MEIVAPKITDLEVIDKIAVQVHDCHVKWRPDIFKHADSIISKEELANMIANNGIFVAKIDDIIVGYVLLTTKESQNGVGGHRKELYIDVLGVDENYRNQGIGRAIMEYVKEYAIVNNYTSLRLTVNEENENARHLYEDIGFKVKNIAYMMQLK